MLKSLQTNQTGRSSSSSRDEVRGGTRRRRHTTAAAHIARLAQRRLQTSVYQELRDVKCSLQNRTLILDGSVSSFYMKQMAQVALRELVERFPQVERIENQLQVPAR